MKYYYYYVAIARNADGAITGVMSRNERGFSPVSTIRFLAKNLNLKEKDLQITFFGEIRKEDYDEFIAFNQEGGSHE